MTDSDSELPGSVDFNDATQVHDWIVQTVQQRAWRPRFAAAIAVALNGTFDRAIDVVEFGSGAGHLAREILAACRIASYAAIDVSPAIHDKAREYLGSAARAVRFIVIDSRAEDWGREFAPVDAVLAMPAERRGDLREPPFRRIREILRPDGLLLYCDHYDRAGSYGPDAALRREELPETLRAAGFRRVDELLELGGMVLVRAMA
ncbi:MAG: class I SAM-dependent methyltransferase [Reyranella sp.]